MSTANPQSQLVLVVDDDEPTRATLRLLLEDDGYQVLEAANGIAALEILRADARHFVVLLDDHMPRLDGLGVLREVVHDRRLKTQHAYILVTANFVSARFALLRVLSFLRVPLVQKPFNVDHIEELVAQAARSLVVAVR